MIFLDEGGENKGEHDNYLQIFEGLKERPFKMASKLTIYTYVYIII